MCGRDDRGDASVPSSARRATRGGGEPRRRADNFGGTSRLIRRSVCRNFVANQVHADKKIDMNGAVPPATRAMRCCATGGGLGMSPTRARCMLLACCHRYRSLRRTIFVAGVARLSRFCVLMNPTCRARDSMENLAGDMIENLSRRSGHIRGPQELNPLLLFSLQTCAYGHSSTRLAPGR